MTGVALVALMAAVQVDAQPTELVGCAGLPHCSDVNHGYLFEVSCPRQWTLFIGRLAFHPLRYIGPINIAVDSRGPAGGSNFGLPLYIECIPVREHPPQLGYCDGVGTVIAQVMGHNECDAWETRGPIDLSYLLAPGDSYVIRLHFVASQDSHASSPYFRCIRVAPAGVPLPPETGVQPMVWGQVKALYRTP